jgi:hypothetical protein
MSVVVLLWAAAVPAMASPVSESSATAKEAGAAAKKALSPERAYGLIRQLSSPQREVRRAASRALLASGDESLLPALVDALFFAPRPLRGDTAEVLEGLSGESFGSAYFDWVEYIGKRTDIEPKEGYLGWKVELLSRISPEFRKVFYQGAPHRIRLQEILSGGVRFDGIPALEHPEFVPVSQAGFMADEETVFGVSVGGLHRAYPVRVLSWHEMLNDTIGEAPLTLSFCTLCGSGIAYSTRTPAGGRYTFGTSGLLYRSNKLMFDRESYSLWSNLTGEPVVGRLALTSVTLEVLPTTLTTWAAWVERHPDSTVMVPDRRLAERWGFDYTPGAADRARHGVAFPVWQQSDALDRNAEVYALRLGGAVKAYPLDVVLDAGLIHDTLGGQPLVLIGDSNGGAVRAYASGGRTFQRNPDGERLVDEGGTVWRLTEEALVAEGDGAEPLPRLPGHVAFWFGWYGFYPQTELYGAESPRSAE